jgi:hypothetical protein
VSPAIVRAVSSAARSWWRRCRRQRCQPQQQEPAAVASAEIDTKPELEIYADEVKAAHGATVGQLDERSLFYLRSRGIPLAEARAC